MSLIVLGSASGSPGVSTTALGLALGWPRPVLLVEADPTGASAVASGYLRGQVEPPNAMTDLVNAHFDDRLRETLSQVSIDLPQSRARVVPGAKSHDQARSLLALWDPLLAVLRSLEETGQDVIVDAGRLGLYGWPEPLVYGADLMLLVTRTELPTLAAAVSWANTLREKFEQAGAAASLGLLLVGEKEPYTAREITRVLQLPTVARVMWDPVSAAVISEGKDVPKATLRERATGRGHWADRPLNRSLRSTRSAITGVIRANEERLAATAGGPA